mgnify:FL=1|jgi:hypothetical protein
MYDEVVFWVSDSDPNWNCTTPGPDSKFIGDKWDPGMLSEKEKEKYGIEEIPVENVDERAVELNIPSEIVDEFYNSGDDVLYFAHNLAVYEVNPPENTSMQDNSESLTKITLIDEINTQIDRNELIIKAFSSISDMTKEDIEMIQTNEEELDLLKDILNKAQAIKEDDLKAIDSLWNVLQAFVLKEVTVSQNS